MQQSVPSRRWGRRRETDGFFFFFLILISFPENSILPWILSKFPSLQRPKQHETGGKFQ
jgi:hypothetical protein